MLNAAKYAEYPVCERKILPQFHQFKAVDWVRMTDKTESLKVVEEALNIKYARRGKLNNPEHLRELKNIKKGMESNKYKFFSFKIIDNNSKTNSLKYIYKLESYLNQVDKNEECNIYKLFYFFDSNITVANADKFGLGPYFSFNLTGDNQIFYFKDEIYVSHWASGHVNEGSNLDVYGVDNKKLCGILAN